MNQKKLKFFLTYFLLFTFTTCNKVCAELKISDRISAIVNNDIILESEVKFTIQNYANKKLLNDIIFNKNILNSMITDLILFQIAQKSNIFIDDKQVEEVIHTLARQNYMTFDQFIQKLINEGINYEIYKNKIRKELMISGISNHEIRNRITIFPEEVEFLEKKIYKKFNKDTEFNIINILIPFVSESDEKISELEDFAYSLIKILKKGVNFDKLIMSFCKKNNKYLKIDKMGWNYFDNLPSIFSEKFFYVQKGQIIGPIKSGIGFHILKVNDIRNNITNNILITDIHARHIFIRKSIKKELNHKSYLKLIDIAKKINSGKICFTEAVEKISEDFNSIKNGGDLGWISVETFNSMFPNSLIYLKKGTINIEPIESSYGWHIIQILNTKEIKNTQQIQKEHAYRLLFNHKFLEEEQNWIEEQRLFSYIKIF